VYAFTSHRSNQNIQVELHQILLPWDIIRLNNWWMGVEERDSDRHSLLKRKNMKKRARERCGETLSGLLSFEAVGVEADGGSSETSWVSKPSGLPNSKRVNKGCRISGRVLAVCETLVFCPMSRDMTPTHTHWLHWRKTSGLEEACWYETANLVWSLPVWNC